MKNKDNLEQKKPCTNLNYISTMQLCNVLSTWYLVECRTVYNVLFCVTRTNIACALKLIIAQRKSTKQNEN